MEFQDLLKSKFTTAILIGMLGLVLFVTAKLFMQKYEVQREIAALEERADRIQSENQELSELINYFQTDEYKERQAREKLNLKKEGEFVVVLPEIKDKGQVLGEQGDEKSNPQKWFDYFFAN